MLPSPSDADRDAVPPAHVRPPPVRGEEELAQHPLDDGAQAPVCADKAQWPGAQQLLDVLLDQPGERGDSRGRLATLPGAEGLDGMES